MDNVQKLNTMIPFELKTKPNWVGHVNKIPIILNSGKPAASNNAHTWDSYKQALNYGSLYDGIGFMFEAPFIGIDLDDCVENGAINEYAGNIISQLDSYTEFSPSGTGVHIIIKGELKAPIKTPTLEVYQTGRYFTVTGNRISKHSLLREIKDLDFLYPEGYSKRVPLAERIGSLQEGNRNNTLTSIAGSLRRKGFDEQEIFELIRPKAIEVGLDEKEAWQIAKSVGRYQPANISETGNSIGEFLKCSEPVDWILPEIVAKKSIGFVAGLPETGKTWILIDLAIEAAKEEGGMWLGRFPVNHAKVLFVDQERFKGETQRRFRAVINAKGMELTQLASLFVKSGTSTRLDLPHSFDAFRKELADLKPDLVIIDSFATIKTVDENNRMEIQKVLEKVKELRTEFGCTFLFIHHEGKVAYNKDDSGEPSVGHMAGSVAIPAAAEMVMTVRKQDSHSSMVYNTKNTLSTTIAPFLVKVTDVDESKDKIKVEAF